MASKKTVKTYYQLFTHLHPIIKFLIYGVLLFLIWSLFYSQVRDTEFINSIYETVTFYLTEFLLRSSGLLLDLLGYDTYILGKNIGLKDAHPVLLDRGCLGRNLIGLFIGFIIAYPGKIINKFWYIPLGVFLINIINIFRISGLVIISDCCPQHLDINHHFIFKYSVYFLILCMWIIWIAKINKLPEMKTLQKNSIESGEN